MNKNTVAVAGVAIVVGALAARIITDSFVPDANAVPFNRVETQVATSVQVNSFCISRGADGGFLVETFGTVQKQIALPDGGTDSQTVQLPPGPQCEIGAFANLSLAQINVCARQARGLEQ